MNDVQEKIIEIIEKEPLIQYSKLEKKITDLGISSKKTMKKHFDKLEGNEVIIYEVGKKEKRCTLSSKFMPSVKTLKIEFEKEIKETKKTIHKIEQDYDKYNYFTRLNIRNDLERTRVRFSNIQQNSKMWNRLDDDLITPKKILGQIKTKVRRSKKKFSEDHISMARKLYDKIETLDLKENKIHNKLQYEKIKPSERYGLINEVDKKYKEKITLTNELHAILDSI